MRERVLSLFFPRQSLRTTMGEWTTAEERHAMQAHPQRLERAQLRQQGIHHLDMLVAATVYDHAPLVRMALHRFKYRGVRELCDVLSVLMLQAAHHLPLTDGAVLCPVPLHWMRRFARGFNQAELLALHVGRALDVPVVPLLRRVVPTGHQMKRRRVQRLTAVRSAFSVHTATCASHVVLIDDVATTGATLDACARTLKHAGVTRVDALVVALG